MVLNNSHQLHESWQFASCEAEIFEDAYAEAWLIGCQVHFGRHFPQARFLLSLSKELLQKRLDGASTPAERAYQAHFGYVKRFHG